MIIVSSRKGFSDPDHISTDGHSAKYVNLQTDEEETCDVDELANEVSGKNVLILVHGYNNEQFEVYDAYHVIEKKLQAHTPGTYDVVIGYSWPGGDHGLEWWKSKSRANSVARMFRFLIEELSQSAQGLDVMSHSLGARVTLKALKESVKNNVVRNYFCTAPAVDNESLERGEEFFDAVSSCQRLFVFHSAKDGVLRFTYTAAEWDRALGLYGPEDANYISRKARNIYVANCKKRVSKHGGYKRSAEVFQYIHAYQTANPEKFKTL